MSKSILRGRPALNASVCLLNSALFLGCAPEDKMTWHDFYNKGIEHHEAKEFGTAIEAYSKVIHDLRLDLDEFSSTDSTLCEAYRLRGLARMRMSIDSLGRFYLNGIDGNNAILLDKSDAGRDRERLDDDRPYRLAVGDFTHAMAVKEDYFGDKVQIQLYLSRAMAYYLLGEFEHSVADYTAVLALDPKCGEALHNRGCVYMCLNNREKAEQDFKNARTRGIHQD